MVTCLLQDSLHHLIAQLDSIRESRCKIALDTLKAVSVGFKVAERDAI